MQKDQFRTLKIPQSMLSEFGGLWKHPNNPAGTKNVRVFKIVEAGHDTEEDSNQTVARV